MTKITDETGAERLEPPAPTIPATARDALADRDPLRIWKAKGAKGVGGEIEAWLCQDTNEIVLSHTLPSGRFSVFAKVAK